MGQDKTLATSVNTELSENWQEHRKLLNQVEGENTPGYQQTPMKAVINEPNKEIIKRNVQNIGDVSDWESTKAYISSFIKGPKKISAIQGVTEDVKPTVALTDWSSKTIHIKSNDERQNYLSNANVKNNVKFDGVGGKIAEDANIRGALLAEDIKASEIAKNAKIKFALLTDDSVVKDSIAKNAEIDNNIWTRRAEARNIANNAYIRGNLYAGGVTANEIGKDVSVSTMFADCTDVSEIALNANIRDDLFASYTSASSIAKNASVGKDITSRFNNAKDIGENGVIGGDIRAEGTNAKNLKPDVKVDGDIYTL